MNLGTILAGLGTGLLAGGPIGGAIGAASAASQSANGALLDAAQAQSEHVYAANQAQLLASNTRLNTLAVKDAETTNLQLYGEAVDEAHNHVVRAYIESVKQVQ